MYYSMTHGIDNRLLRFEKWIIFIPGILAIAAIMGIATLPPAQTPSSEGGGSIVITRPPANTSKTAGHSVAANGDNKNADSQSNQPSAEASANSEDTSKNQSSDEGDEYVVSRLANADSSDPIPFATVQKPSAAQTQESTSDSNPKPTDSSTSSTEDSGDNGDSGTNDGLGLPITICAETKGSLTEPLGVSLEPLCVN